MSLLNYPAKSLINKCNKVNLSDKQSLNNIISLMVKTLRYGNTIYGSSGLSISANQLGYNENIIVLGSNINERIKNKNMNIEQYTYREIINMSIVELSKERAVFWEFCLSDNENIYLIDRPKLCTIKYQAINGKENIESFDFIHSRIILHENDHIEGKEYYSNYIRKLSIKEVFSCEESFNDFRLKEKSQLLF